MGEWQSDVEAELVWARKVMPADLYAKVEQRLRIEPPQFIEFTVDGRMLIKSPHGTSETPFEIVESRNDHLIISYPFEGGRIRKRIDFADGSFTLSDDSGSVMHDDNVYRPRFIRVR